MASLEHKPGIKEFLGTLGMTERERLGKILRSESMDEFLKATAIVAHRRGAKIPGKVYALICQETGYDADAAKQLSDD